MKKNARIDLFKPKRAFLQLFIRIELLADSFDAGKILALDIF
jgi:hypothetical protein